METFMMHSSYTLPVSHYRHSRTKNEGRKCNCCPYGYHIDIDFVRYCEKLANSQLLGNPKTASLRCRGVRKKRESIESLLGIPATIQKADNGELQEKKEERKSDIFSEGLEKAVVDFEIMLKNSCSNNNSKDVIVNAEGGQDTNFTSQNTIRTKDLLEPEMCAACKANGSNNESAVKLQDIRTQMAASLKRMKELEDEVKLVPQLKNQLKKLCWENKHLTKLLERKEECIDQNERGQLRGCVNKPLTVHTRTIGTGSNIMQRNVAVSTSIRLTSQGTDPILTNEPKPKLKHVETNTEHLYNVDLVCIDSSKLKLHPSHFMTAENREMISTDDFGAQVFLPPVSSSKKNVAVQIKPHCSNVAVYTELYLTESFTQTPKTLKKDVGVGINMNINTILKSDIGINTDCKKLASTASDTMDLMKTADVGTNTAKKKRVDASVETCADLNFNLDKVAYSPEWRKKKKDVNDKKKIIPSSNLLRSRNNERSEVTEELQEKIFPPIPIASKRLEKKEPTKEMKGAMKVLNDSLQKSSSREIPYNMKNAINIIQQEWFKVSSTAEANPLDVEDYLDCFEELSVSLLEYIVNMTDVSGNTAMHYAVSNGNFDVVSILLDSKVCNINKLNAAGYTCIMLVALTKAKTETDRQVVRRLFHMADVNIRAKPHGQTALMLAVSHGRIDTVHLLLESGADINIQDEDGSTALMCAAEHGYIDIVKILLAQPDCDLSITDLDGNTALAIAMEAGNRDIGVLLYAQEHFSRTNSPFGSLKVRRAKSATPTLRTRSPTPPNSSFEHSL